MNRVLVPALCAVLFVSAALLADDASKKETPKANPLVGTYKIVAGEENGEPTAKDKIDGSLVRITKDEIIGVDKDDNQVFIAQYEVVNQESPWKITMKSKSSDGKVVQSVGLAKHDGKQIKIIYNLPGAPEPTEFKTVKGQHLFVLNPVKVGDASDK